MQIALLSLVTRTNTINQTERQWLQYNCQSVVTSLKFSLKRFSCFSLQTRAVELGLKLVFKPKNEFLKPNSTALVLRPFLMPWWNKTFTNCVCWFVNYGRLCCARRLIWRNIRHYSSIATFKRSTLSSTFILTKDGKWTNRQYKWAEQQQKAKLCLTLIKCKKVYQYTFYTFV